MNLSQEKDLLSQRIKDIQKLLEDKKITSLYQQELQNLADDLQNNSYYVTTVGEFKRGKSTLTNSLIGKSILPADVTPTTATINLIRHNNEEYFEIYYENGTRELEVLNKSNLKKLTFLESEDFLHIQHLEIATSFQYLNENIVLIDTPGVGDLNEHRIDVTYSYIPRSSLIIFVIDCSTPLRRTEIDYLKNHILPNLYGELVIVANFYDRIDEDEWEETEEYITRKLEKILNNIPYSLIPFSAIENVDNKTSPEFKVLKNKINEVVQKGVYSKRESQYFNKRYVNLVEKIEQEIIHLTSISEANENELYEAIQQIERFKKKIAQYEKKLEQYLSERKEEVNTIIKKSVYYFENRLKTVVTEKIQDHAGGKFKHFIEIEIPKLIQNEINNWISSYAQNAKTLISKVENQTYTGLEQLLKQSIRNDTVSNINIRLDDKFGRVTIEGKDDNGSIITGGIAASGSVALLLLGVGPLAPVVALAGYPLLNKLIADEKLKSVKEEFLPIALDSVDKMMQELKNRLHRYLNSEFVRIEKDVIQNLDNTLQQNLRRLELELQLKKQKLLTEPKITLKELEAIK